MVKHLHAQTTDQGACHVSKAVTAKQPTHTAHKKHRQNQQGQFATLIEAVLLDRVHKLLQPPSSPHLGGGVHRKAQQPQQQHPPIVFQISG